MPEVYQKRIVKRALTKEMKCPKCKSKIDEVYVISKVSELCSLSKNKIVTREDLIFLETLKINCSICGKDIKSVIEEYQFGSKVGKKIINK